MLTKLTYRLTKAWVQQLRFLVTTRLLSTDKAINNGEKKEKAVLVGVFPGQGAQRKGMGEELFDIVPEFRAVEGQIDRQLGYSLRQVCVENPNNFLSQTQYSQPCLYVVNALYFYKASAGGKYPDMFAGHSLGEYNALLAAGAFDFLTGLQLVQKRGELMARQAGGAMAAIVGLDPDKIRVVLESRGLSGIDFANFNTPSQTVISGLKGDIDQAISALDEAGAEMCIPLWVNAAFHSRYMSDVATAFADYLQQYRFNPLKFPVIANVTGEPYPAGDFTESVRSLLTRQIVEPVQWTSSIRYLIRQGATEFDEFGYTTVLAPFIEKIRDGM